MYAPRRTNSDDSPAVICDHTPVPSETPGAGGDAVGERRQHQVGAVAGGEPGRGEGHLGLA
jgi:hypothetical protein